MKFFFREINNKIQPQTNSIFTKNVNASFEEITKLGAKITNPIQNKPWRLRQFTLEDINGHQFHIYHDISSQQK